MSLTQRNLNNFCLFTQLHKTCFRRIFFSFQLHKCITYFYCFNCIRVRSLLINLLGGSEGLPYLNDKQYNKKLQILDDLMPSTDGYAEFALQETNRENVLHCKCSTFVEMIRLLLDNTRMDLKDACNVRVQANLMIRIGTSSC